MNPATLSFAAMPGRRNAFKFGAKVVRHGRYVAFQMAAAAVPRYLFAGTPRPIAEPRPPRQPQRRQVFDPQEFAQTPWERYVLMPTKSPMSGARRTDLTRFRGASPRGPALPKTVERGNLTLDRPSSVGRAAAGAAGQALNLVPRRGG
jgi:hypothetical protein